MVIKVTHNIRINSDHNIAFSLESIVGTDEEVKDFGYVAGRYIELYSKGLSEYNREQEQ